MLILAQKLTGILFTLTDTVTFVAVPGTRFVNQVQMHTKIDDLTHVIDATTVHDLEFRLFEWRSNLVLDDFNPRFITNDFVTFLNSADAADIKTN